MRRLGFLCLLCFSSCFINYVGKGYEAYTKGDLESAEQFYRTAVRKKPRDAIAHNNLGVVLQDLDRTEEALPYLKLATVLSKNPYAAPHINLARAYLEMGNLDEALKAGEKGIGIDGGNVFGQLILANIYVAKNMKLPEARSHALAATQKIPELDRPAAWSTLAEAEYKLSNVDAAMAAIDTAISLDTDNPFYRQQKALYKP